MKETQIESNRFYWIGNERRFKKSNAATIEMKDGKPVPGSDRPASPNKFVDHIEPKVN